MNLKGNRMFRGVLIAIAILALTPAFLFAIDAKVETIEGDVFQITDFSMDGRRSFSIDRAGGIGRVDWKEIASFEIKQVGANYWVQVQFTTGKKDTLRLRQRSFFSGRSDFGQVSIPFEKVKKVSLVPEAVEGKKKEDVTVKETVLPVDSLPQESDRITLRNGDVLMGDLLADALTIRTVFGTIVFKKTDISRVSFGKGTKGRKESEKDMLSTKYGDKLSGTIPDGSLKMKLRTGTNILIPREHIQEVEFSVVSEMGSKTPQEQPESIAPKSLPDVSLPLKRN